MTRFGARHLVIVRRTAITAWLAVAVSRIATTGLTFNRELVLVYVCTGLLAASIGRRRLVLIIRDWLPFAVVLLVYDLSRGAADLIGAPTLWQWQPEADRRLFSGSVPTVWLQEHLKMPSPPWWEVAISTVYMSFFILPYVLAGALWLRNRGDWAAFVRRFVVLSFTALVVNAVLPAAPPWAAARCRPADVAGGPAEPACMFSAGPAPGGGLLGPMTTVHAGQRLRRTGVLPRFRDPAPRGGARAARRGSGQRQPGDGHPVAACGTVGDDRGLPVGAGGALAASRPGRLRAGHGVRAGLLGRALRGRHPGGLGAGGSRRRGDPPPGTPQASHGGRGRACARPR
jgi:hypothetical protein